MERTGLARTCAGIIDGKYDPTTQARTLRVHDRGADQASDGSIHSCASAFQDVPVGEMEEKTTMLKARDDGMEDPYENVSLGHLQGSPRLWRAASSWRKLLAAICGV